MNAFKTLNDVNHLFYESILEQEKQKREQCETELIDAKKRVEFLEEKLKASKLMIIESISRYEKIYRSFLASDNGKSNKDYNQATLEAELSLVDDFIKYITVNENEIVPSLEEDASMTFCYKMLTKISRTYALVTKQLYPKVRDIICVFYLILRATDTIEDDIKIDSKQRIQWLHEFPSNIGNVKYRLSIGETPEEEELMENYYHVANKFNSFEIKYQKIIREVAQIMADGMAYFIENEINTLEDYNSYCYCVSGVVGVGIVKVFIEAGLVSRDIEKNFNFAQSTGIFLQSTNIARDFSKDLEQGRFFWPREIWSKYTDDYKTFLNNGDENSVKCLNEMVTNAMKRFNDVVDCLSYFTEQSAFRACAIPPLLALAVLQLLYNNPSVFSECLKIIDALSFKYCTSCNNLQDFKLLASEVIEKWNNHAYLKVDSNMKTILECISEKLAI